jgi:hypothetical protein
MDGHSRGVGAAAAAAFFLAASIGAFWTPLGPLAAVGLSGLVGWWLGRAPAGSPRTPRLAGVLVGSAAAAGQFIGGLIFLIYLQATGRSLTVSIWPGVAAFPWLYVLGGSLLLGALDQFLAPPAAMLAAAVSRRVAARRRGEPAAGAPDHPHWHRRPQAVPLNRFSSGARHPFDWYLSGESAVPVSYLDDIAAWLKTCQYVRDADLFVESDFWQHPRTFEQLQRGDCEDHALWAWRKMVELDLEAEFMVGRDLQNGGRHAWVMVRQHDALYAFEATRKSSSPLITPDQAVTRFQPEYGVDQHLQTFRYAGAGAGKATPIQEEDR